MFELKNAGKEFQQRWLFKNLNLTAHAGDFISILGPSGCGKSTLLRILSGLDTVSEGSFSTSSQDPSGFVFQESCLLPWLNVFENVALGATQRQGRDSHAAITKILEVVKLTDAAQLFPRQLSGGMKMRVSIARALVNNKKILFMDEPFAALDDFTRFELQDELLEYWRQYNMTIFFVTHSLSESVFLSQKLWLFPQGQQKTFQEWVLEKPSTAANSYRNSAEYFQTVTTVTEHLRVKK
ncbi:MAG: ABC transporter ATP-binding protein [Bdellovibrionaceae bacterium]|nr:ABC transporter ATP-binding protein [Pseudobdellovibrionaceae bacterium]